MISDQCACSYRTFTEEEGFVDLHFRGRLFIGMAPTALVAHGEGSRLNKAVHRTVLVRERRRRFGGNHITHSNFSAAAITDSTRVSSRPQCLVIQLTFVVKRLFDMTNSQLLGDLATMKPPQSDPHVVECIGVGTSPSVDIRPKTFLPTCLSCIQSSVFFTTPDMVP